MLLNNQIIVIFVVVMTECNFVLQFSCDDIIGYLLLFGGLLRHRKNQLQSVNSR